MDLTVPYLHQGARAGMWDVVTPGFSTKQNQGFLINNPMFSEESHYLYSPCRWLLDGRKGSTSIHCEYYENKNYLVVTNGGYLLSNLTAFEREVHTKYQAQIDLAVTRAWADVDVSEMQILASLGELPETLAWIRDILKRVLSLTRAFKKRLETNAITRTLEYAFSERGLKKDARRLASWLKILEARRLRKGKTDPIEAVSKIYLEYRYAIRPLFYDIMSALAALRKTLANQRMTARGKEEVLSKSNKTIIPPRDAYSASHYVDMVIEEKMDLKLSARAGVLYAIEDGIDSLLSIWGFDQPLESLWELVPFSFIIDWFFSIGDVISSWSQSSGLTALLSWCTVVLDSTLVRTCKTVNISNRDDYVWDTKTVQLGKSYWATRRKWRVPEPARPILPTFDLQLNLGKILDLGAIGRSLIGSSGTPQFVRR